MRSENCSLSEQNILNYVGDNSVGKMLDQTQGPEIDPQNPLRSCMGWYTTLTPSPMEMGKETLELADQEAR